MTRHFLASWFVGRFCATPELVDTSLFAHERPLGRLRGVFEGVDMCLRCYSIAIASHRHAVIQSIASATHIRFSTTIWDPH